MSRASVVGVYNETSDLWLEGIPNVYNSNTWKSCHPYIYTDGEWRPAGAAGTLMVPFITSDGNYFYTSDGKMFLVRQHE